MSASGFAVALALLSARGGDDVWVRDLRTVEDVVDAIWARAVTAGRSRVVVALDDRLPGRDRWSATLSARFKDANPGLDITARSSNEDDLTAPEWAQRTARSAGKGTAVVLVTDRAPDADWDEEKIGERFAKAGVQLWIVAPEAPFGMDAPFNACRFLPYVSRPVFFAGRQFGYRLLSQGPCPRFTSALPSLLEQDVKTESRPECDVPSGFGYWAYGRACFLASGRCFVFADGSDVWLDRCQRSEALDSLADPLDRPAIEQWKEAARSPWSEQIEAAIPTTLKSMKALFDGVEEGRPLDSSLCLRRLREGRPTGTLRLTLIDRPYDERTLDSWRQFATTLADPIATHDRTAYDLARSLAQNAAPCSGPEGRLRADALLQLFWFQMSAFHLEALRVVTASPEKFLFEPVEHEGYVILRHPKGVVRLSDCLEAYDGRRFPPELEAAFAASHAPLPMPPQIDQSNTTHADFTDPDYRAERGLDAVLAHLDPALVARAHDVIATARMIHTRLRGTPWDWVVYYSALEAYVFGTRMSFDGNSVKPSMRPDKEPPPETPRLPPPPSTGGAKPSSTGGSGN